MKKLVLAAVAATALMGSAVSAATFNVYNHTQATVILDWVIEGGGTGHRTLPAGHSITGIKADKFQTEVFYVGYGKNTYGSPTDKNEYTISIWQQQPGYFAQFINEVK